MSNVEENANPLHPVLISMAKIKENEKPEQAESYSDAKATLSSKSDWAPSPKSSHSEKSPIKRSQGDPDAHRDS